MKWGDIRGEANAAGHEDWINLESVSFGIYKDPVFAGSRPQFQEMTISKQTDLSTAPMLSALAAGELIPELEVDITEETASGQGTYKKYRLQDVLVTSYFVTSVDAQGLPSEAFSLNYTNIESTYWQFGPDGIVLERVHSYWDIPTNTGGYESGNEPPTIRPISLSPVEQASPIDVLIVINEMETPPEQLVVTVETDRPDLILDLAIGGTGFERTLSFRSSALYSGFGVITVRVSDGVHQTSMSFAVMVGMQMTPFEAFMAAYFTPSELQNPKYSSPIGDPDNDDIPTIVEYALLTNPREYTLPQQAVRVTRENTESGPVIRLDYRRRTDDKNIRPIPWMAPESLLFAPIHNNPLYEESATAGENPFYEDVTGTYPVDPDGADMHLIRMQVDAE